MVCPSSLRNASPCPRPRAAAASAFGRIAAEAALSEDSELEGRSRDGLPPINAAVGLTKEAAFENMQALLREKSDETGSDVLRKEKEKAPAVSASAPAESATRTEEEKEEEEWSARPVRVSLATGRDGRVVATLATRGEKGAESVDDIRTSGFATDDGSSRETARLARGDEENAEECAFDVARARLDEGLASLRAARLAARDAGSNPTRMLEADADAAAAVANLEAAAEAFDRLATDANDAGPNDAGPNEKDFPTIFAGAAAARGNLGNALLARGRLQVRLSSMAASQERRASLAGVRAGAEGAAAFHAEIAEECLVLAGRAFRKALASRDPFRKSGDSDSDSDSERDSRNAEKRSAGARALTGWGAALALRGDAALASAARRRDASLASRSRENIQRRFRRRRRVRGFGVGGGGARGGGVGEVPSRARARREFGFGFGFERYRKPAILVYSPRRRARARSRTGATRCVSRARRRERAGGDFGSRVRARAGAGIRIRVRRSAAAPAGRVLGPRGGVLRRGHAVGRGGMRGRRAEGATRVRGGV